MMLCENPMSEESTGRITELLVDANAGSEHATDELYQLVYGELRAIALRQVGANPVVFQNSTERLEWLSRALLASGDRIHQGLGNRLIDGEIADEPVDHIERRDRLGGILRSYHRAAA